MATPRSGHTATLLPDGRVLVVGGRDTTGVVGTAELYDQSTDSWSPAGGLVTARTRHTATLLASGKVLVVGGFDATGPSASAELYDPATNTWSPAGSMDTPRSGHSAALLPNGRVLVAGGGRRSSPLASAELFAPPSAWLDADAMRTGRLSHTATPLGGGTVLVAGGCCDDFGGAFADAELYEFTWTDTANLDQARELHTATRLPSGEVLVAGGADFESEGGIRSAELYDAAAGRWEGAADMAIPRHGHRATLLANGSVLVVGGFSFFAGEDPAAAELYTPAAGDWSSAGRMAVGRSSASATLLRNGKVLVAGGSAPSAQSLASTEVYTPATSLTASAPYFGNQPVGTQSATAYVAVTNIGDSPLFVEGVTVEGVHAGDFSVMSNTCAAEDVPRQGSCLIGMSLTPSADGPRTAALAIVANTQAGSYNVPLTGNGEAPVAGTIAAPELGGSALEVVTRSQLSTALGADLLHAARRLRRLGIGALLRRGGFSAGRLDALLPGTFAAKLTGRPRGIGMARRVVLARGSSRASSPGPHALAVKVTRRGRRLLRRDRRAELGLTIQFRASPRLTVVERAPVTLRR